MLHKDVTLGFIHQVHNWAVANLAARLALVVAVADVGKVCWQLDTNDWYVLTDDSPMTWVLLSSDPTPIVILPVACSDELSPIAIGTNKVTFRSPCGFTLVTVRASLTTAQTSGSIFTIDINVSGVSIISTKLTIDNTEKTSTTAATAFVFVAGATCPIADDAEITIDVDQIGSGTAAGLKIYLVGYETTVHL